MVDNKEDKKVKKCWLCGEDMVEGQTINVDEEIYNCYGCGGYVIHGVLDEEELQDLKDNCEEDDEE